MCFSAEASFTASAVILTLGVVAMKKSRTVPQRVFATIPFFFGIQQLIEGVLWLVLSHNGNFIWKQILTQAFLFFAWVIWPVFVPISMRMLEKKRLRKKTLTVFLFIGCLVSAGFIYVLAFHNVRAAINSWHIDYTFDYHPAYSWVASSLYLVPTVVSLLVSSIKRMWLFGLLNMLSYALTKVFFKSYVISVWCFFGAISSVIILLIILEMNRQKKEAMPTS